MYKNLKTACTLLIQEIWASRCRCEKCETSRQQHPPFSLSILNPDNAFTVPEMSSGVNNTDVAYTQSLIWLIKYVWEDANMHGHFHIVHDDVECLLTLILRAEIGIETLQETEERFQEAILFSALDWKGAREDNPRLNVLDGFPTKDEAEAGGFPGWKAHYDNGGTVPLIPSA